MAFDAGSFFFSKKSSNTGIYVQGRQKFSRKNKKMDNILTDGNCIIRINNYQTKKHMKTTLTSS